MFTVTLWETTQLSTQIFDMELAEKKEEEEKSIGHFIWVSINVS